MGRLIGYVRVSTEEQNLDRQLAVMGDVDKLYKDKMSGKNTNRVGLQQMFKDVREGDTIRVKSIDRLARSTRDLLSVLDDMEKRGVKVEFIDTPYLNTNTKEGRFFVTILGALAEMERVTIKERQAEGIALAKARGVYDQDPKLSVEQVEEACRLYESGESFRAVARRIGCPHSSVANAIKGKGAYGKGEYAKIQRCEIRPSNGTPGKLMFTVEQVTEIRRRYADGETQIDLANEFGTSTCSLGSMIRGKGAYGKGEYANIPIPNKEFTKPPKLSRDDVLYIRRSVDAGVSMKTLADELGESHSTIYNAVHGKGAYGKGTYADIPLPNIRRGRKSA